MSQQGNTIEVVDKFGWRKQYPLPLKPIIHLGSAASNDIVLLDEHGGGVSEVHAQIIAPTTHHAGYQLVNLSESAIALGQSGGALTTRSAVDVGEGSIFQLGDFTVIFHGEGGFYGGPTLGSSRNIGVRLVLSHTTLAPNETIEGTVTIRNIGELTGVQFDVTLEGLTTDCFDLEPGPLLSSGAEKHVALRILHRGALPAAGNNQITLRVVAPNSYPGERVIVSQMIEVLPMYRHKLGLLIGKADSLPQLAEAEKLIPKEAVKTARPPTPASPGGATDWWAAPTIGAVAAAAAATQPTPAYRAAPPAPAQTGDWWGAAAATVTDSTPEKSAADAAADWFSAPAPATEPPASPSPQETEAASWWATPEETASTPPADSSDATLIGAGVAAAAGIATGAAAADWWATPPTETPPAQLTAVPLAPTPATPEAEPPDSGDAANWWAAPAAETPPAPAAIPPAAHVPRQADDWFAAPADEATPTGSAAPPIPPAADVPRQADDWFAAPPEPETVETEASGDWPVAETTPKPPVEAASGEPAANADAPPPAVVAGAAALAGVAAGALAAATPKQAPEAKLLPAEPESIAPEAAKNEPPFPAAEETPPAAPPIKAEAATIETSPSPVAHKTDAAPIAAAVAPPPAAVEPPPAEGSFWTKTKKWGMGLAVALPFVKATRQPEADTPAEPESAEPKISAAEAAVETAPPAAEADPGKTAVFRAVPPPALEASEEAATPPPAEITVPEAAVMETPVAPAPDIALDEADEATLVAVAPPDLMAADLAPPEVQPAETAPKPEPKDAPVAPISEQVAPTPVDAAASDNDKDWWGGDWSATPAAASAIAALPEPEPTAAPASPAEKAPASALATAVADDWWPVETTNDTAAVTESLPATDADDSGEGDWWPVAAPDNAAATAQPEPTAAPELPVEESPLTPKPISDSPERGRHWGKKEAWGPLVPGSPQPSPEEWWHDDSDFDVAEPSNT